MLAVYPLDLAPSRHGAPLMAQSAGKAQSWVAGGAWSQNGIQTFSFGAADWKQESGTLQSGWSLEAVHRSGTPYTIAGPTGSVVNTGGAWLGPGICI